MTRKYTIIVLLIFASLLACKKYKDLKNDAATGGYSDYIIGRLVLLDTLTQRAINTPLGAKQVTVSFQDITDSLNYIVSAKSDADGYFNIKSLNPKRKYRLWYRELVDGKLFSGVNYSNTGNDSLVITAGIALSGQTGAIFKVHDANGNPLTGADICVFRSPIPFDASTCDGATFAIKSDAYGNGNKFNLAAGIYYVLSQITIEGTKYTKKTSFEIKDKVEIIELLLGPPGPSSANGYDFLVTESGQPINNAKVCLFKSHQLFERDTCESSNYSAITNPLGKASIRSIEPGIYYVLADVSLTGFRLIGRDTIEVDNTVKTLTLPVVRY